MAHPGADASSGASHSTRAVRTTSVDPASAPPHTALFPRRKWSEARIAQPGAGSAEPRPSILSRHLGRRQIDGSAASALSELSASMGGRRVLVVASTGGHLAQAAKWASILDLGAGSTFVTFDSEQARGLLEGQSVVYVPYIRPRGGLNVV